MSKYNISVVKDEKIRMSQLVEAENLLQAFEKSDLAKKELFYENLFRRYSKSAR